MRLLVRLAEIEGARSLLDIVSLDPEREVLDLRE